MTLKTIIADDEPLARERLKLLLSADPEIDISSECRNGDEVLSALKIAQFDLLFLDIQMPARDGFEVIDDIGVSNMPITIFVTAHNEYAVNAFEVHALDYLVKPIERVRLSAALDRVKERIRLKDAFTAQKELASVLQTLRNTDGNYPQRLLAKSGNMSSLVRVDDIEWIEASDYYVCLHVGGKKHLLRESIRALEEKLNPGKFVRLHRSAIVNIDHVREIHRDGRTDGWVLLATGDRIRLNKTGWHKLIAMSGVS
jgi:two-component system LytT family response regulator